MWRLQGFVQFGAGVRFCPYERRGRSQVYLLHVEGFRAKCRTVDDRTPAMQGLSHQQNCFTGTAKIYRWGFLVESQYKLRPNPILFLKPSIWGFPKRRDPNIAP